MNKESSTRKGHQDFNIGDMFVIKNYNNNIIIVVEIKGELIRGIYSDVQKVVNVGYKSYISGAVSCGEWKHYPVNK